VTFYDSVLRELLVAIGGALFVGNLLALVRRRPPPSLVEKSKDSDTVVEAAPIARTLTYAMLGFIVMIWGIASMVAS
jgi:hypothetical protein